MSEVLTIEFQESLLRAVLQDPSFLLQHRDCLDSAYVGEPDLSYLMSLILQHHDRYSSPISRSALMQRLADEKKLDDMREIVEPLFTEPVRDVSFIKDRIKDFAKSRAMLEALPLVEQFVSEKKYAEAQDAFLKAANVGEDPSDSEDYTSRLRPRIAAYANRDGTEKIATGLLALDSCLDGGVARGEQAVLVGDSGVGKTTILVNFAKHALLTGHRVAFYSLEVSKRVISRRLDMSIAGMTKQELMSMRKSAYDRISEALERKKEGRLLIHHYPSYSMTVPALRANIKLLRDRDGFFPDLIIVDYGDLLACDRKYSELRHELSSIFAGLRSLAVEFNCAQWTVTQSNREGAKSGREDDESLIDKEHVREDYSKVGTTDILLSVNQTRTEKRRGVCRLFLAKARDEEDGQVVKALFDKRRSQLRDLDLEDEA